MNPFRKMALIAALTATAGIVEAQFVLVSLKDMEGNETYRAISEDEFRTVLKEVEVRQRHYRTALQDVKREWRANEDYGRKPFPSLSAPSARILRRYASMTDAQEALDDREERDMRSEERRQESQKTSVRTRDKEAMAKEEQRNRERATMQAIGLTLLNQQIDELIAREKARQSETAPPGKSD
jgi:hypothetical protein